MHLGGSWGCRHGVGPRELVDFSVEYDNDKALVALAVCNVYTLLGQMNGSVGESILSLLAASFWFL